MKLVVFVRSSIGLIAAATLTLASSTARSQPNRPQVTQTTEEHGPYQILAPRPLRATIIKRAREHGLPVWIVDAVASIESSYNSASVGGVGEIGIMQVRPETASMLGFQGTIERLADPEVNIHYGAKYLAGAWQQTGGHLCRTLIKYRAGHGEHRASPLSVAYCARAREHLQKSGVLSGLDPGKGAAITADFFPQGSAGRATGMLGGLGRASASHGGFIGGGRGHPCGFVLIRKVARK